MEQEKLNEIIASHGLWLQDKGGKRANLEGAELPIGVYQIVGPGCCNRCTTYDVINNQIVCGCWNDGKGNHLDSFVEQIEKIYGPYGKKPNSVYYAEYMSAVDFFRAMKDLNKKS